MKTCPNCGYVDRRLDKFSYEQFALFWKAYPRKVGKGAAEKIWEKMKGDAEIFKKILEAIEAQKKGESWLKDNGAYIPHPSTWLNQRRWEDEVVIRWQDPFKENTQEKMDEAKKRLEDIREREWERINALRGQNVQ